MRKLLLLSLLITLSASAQEDDLTLESSSGPSIVEDGTDFSNIPAEEPLEAPDSPDVTENIVLPETPVEELTNNSFEEKTIAEPHDATPDESMTEMADSAPEELETPNVLKDDRKEEPSEVAENDPVPAISTPVITTEAPKDDRDFKHRASHWVTTFAFEGLKYEVPFEFEGERRNVRDRDQELYGGRIGFGGQIYLGGGFFTTSMAEAFYVGTLTQTIQVADPEVEGEEAGSIKRTGGLYGLEASQNLGYIFEFRTKNPFMDEWAYLTFEPFVEAGIGVSRAYNAVKYEYDTGTSADGVQEEYKKQISDTLGNARIGAGFNITGSSGFFMTAKVSINRYEIFERKVDSYAKFDNGTVTDPDEETQKDVKIDPITVFTLGGGYKF